MRKHSVWTYIFIICIDIVALILFVFSMIDIDIAHSPLKTLADFFIWTIIILLANFGGLFSLVGLKADTGWCTSVELAGALVLSFPYYAIAICFSAFVMQVQTITKEKSVTIFGNSFNASNNIISAMASDIVYDKTHLLVSSTIFESIIPLIFGAITFACCHIILLTALISIDTKVKLKKVDTLSKDFIIMESILIIIGALLGRIYQLDIFLVIFMLMPLPLLNNILKKSNEAKLVYIDEKTGLYNYRYLDNKLAEINNKSLKSQRMFSIVFADMDRLRDVNNTYGHQIGDKAIIMIANVLKETIHENSYAIRFGGEEFILLLFHCSKSLALEIAEQARSKINDTNILLDSGEKLKISVSFGVASYPEDADTTNKLIKAADLAVYSAKNCGRNQVKAYKEYMCEVND